jgi:hypothetical protein
MAKFFIASSRKVTLLDLLHWIHKNPRNSLQALEKYDLPSLPKPTENFIDAENRF